jgi:MFS family permease
MGVGSIAGVATTEFARLHRATTVMGAAAMALGLDIALLAQVDDLVRTAVAMFTLGIVFIVATTTINMHLQSGVLESFRGRVMGLYLGTLFGGTAAGGLVCGYVADEYGASASLALMGSATLAVAVTASWRMARSPSDEGERAERMASRQRVESSLADAHPTDTPG